MSSILETAKLILTPNGYKAETAYSLKPFDGTGDFGVVRATTATRVNSAGLIESVAANVPRINYPIGGGCPHWLVEPQRTNLLLRSEEFDNAYWTKENFIQITPNDATAPDGLLTADKLFVTSGSTGFNRTSRAVNVTIGQNYCFSIFVKPNGYNFFLIRVQNFLPSGLVNIAFNLTDKTITFAESGLTGFITEKENGWIRLGFFGVANTSTPNLFFRPQPNATIDNTISAFTGDGTSGAYIWGAQLEQGSTASSYIPTVATAITRNADVITVAPPAGTTEIVEYFADGTTNTETVIPVTYQLPNAEIEKVIMT
jgi:hypothetical protein